MTTDAPKIGDLRVWHIPQVPGEPFHVLVKTPEEAKKILDVLAAYDAFQLENNIKPDYCNAGGLEIFEQQDCGMYPGWIDWHHPDTDESIDEWEPGQ